MKKIMITGGMGFIGSNLVRYWLEKYPETRVINVDCQTYAARPMWVREMTSKKNGARHDIWNVDIRSRELVKSLMTHTRPDAIIHLAAESHVCRSIAGPEDFIKTNVVGTFNLLEEFRKINPGGRFHHVSTDEVFGSCATKEQLTLPKDHWPPSFTEDTPLAPTSPYAASKASSDMVVQCYHHTYSVDTIITNCSNNYGPNQHLEKLIPKTIWALANAEPMTIYGTGLHRRDWIYVEDHCRAIDLVFHKGKKGERYLVGTEDELSNSEVVDLVRQAYEKVKGPTQFQYRVTSDRPSDDERYSVNALKLRELGWIQSTWLSEGLEDTVRWYLARTKEQGGVL